MGSETGAGGADRRRRSRVSRAGDSAATRRRWWRSAIAITRRSSGSPPTRSPAGKAPAVATARSGRPGCRARTPVDGAARGARLFIVPRPSAPQSELRIGHVAVARNTPDYHALVAANMVLGGQFVSRINLNLREDKGFTYGARTAFDFRRLPGPFVAAGQRADGRDRARDRGVARRDRRHPRPPPGQRRGAGARRRRPDARLRAQLRDAGTDRPRRDADRLVRPARRLLREFRPRRSSG